MEVHVYRTGEIRESSREEWYLKLTDLDLIKLGGLGGGTDTYAAHRSAWRRIILLALAAWLGLVARRSVQSLEYSVLITLYGEKDFLYRDGASIYVTVATPGNWRLPYTIDRRAHPYLPDFLRIPVVLELLRRSLHRVNNCNSIGTV